MEDEALPGALRRDRMARLIHERGFSRVAELSRVFRTSPVTVRSDLDELESLGLVRRVHGGAVPTTSGSVADAPGGSADRAPATTDPLAKTRAAIGAVAASLVSDGDTVVVAGGTTARACARALTRRTELADVTVVTNDLHVALELQPVVPRSTVVMTGGTLRPDEPILTDPLADVLLRDLAADLAIVGCTGVSREHGVTDGHLQTAAMNRRLLEAARRRCIVATGTKVGARGVGRSWEAHRIDVLVTDTTADDDEVAALRDAGVEVERVG